MKDEKVNLPPLVSVVVITYNSEKFILETLDSIKEQTYDEIELIISDDASVDQTLCLCKKWVQEHGERFVNITILNSPTNMGISANCNRACNAVGGEFIKMIAGDDTLAPNCICDNVNYCQKNTKIEVVHSVAFLYQDKMTEENFLGSRPLSDIFLFDVMSPQDQHHFLLRKSLICSPTLFFSKNIFEKYIFDESIPMIEDLPYYLNLTSNNIKTWFMNIHTINYRIHKSSVSHSNSKKEIFSDYFEKRILLDRKMIYPYISSFERFFNEMEYKRKLLFVKTGMNKNTWFMRFIYKATRLPYTLFLQLDFFYVHFKMRNKYKIS